MNTNNFKVCLADGLNEYGNEAALSKNEYRFYTHLTSDTNTIKFTSILCTVCFASKKFKRSFVCIQFPAIVAEPLLNSVKI